MTGDEPKGANLGIQVQLGYNPPGLELVTILW